MAEDAAASAVRRYEQRLAKDPASLAFAALADLYRKAGRTREAIALCRDGLERYPHYTTARLILAKAYLTEGNREDALTELSQVVAQSPDDVQAHRLLADLYRRRGALDLAARHLDRVVALDPGDREAARLRDLLRSGGAPGETSGLRKILEDDTFITVSFATICLEQGLMEDAAAIFLRILKRDPDNLSAREGLEEALGGRSQRRTTRPQGSGAR
ncbi:MAG: tetratricopeptide repeat protein [Candidatus Rokubacteria bacterium]|nr:tetratricopeptide repeat protein [Candidatus Rokubacteria bacterium]